MEPVFLTKRDILHIHSDMIESYGGSHGIRDSGLLESALAQPQAGFGGKFLCKNLFEMAAAYAYHLIQNRSLHRWKQAVGAVAPLVFLDLNDIPCEPPVDKYEDFILRIARGELDKSAIAEFLRPHSRPVV